MDEHCDQGPDRKTGEAGQAQLELIAGLPLLALSAVVALQLLAVGYAQSLVDGAAEVTVKLTDKRE